MHPSPSLPHANPSHSQVKASSTLYLASVLPLFIHSVNTTIVVQPTRMAMDPAYLSCLDTLCPSKNCESTTLEISSLVDSTGNKGTEKSHFYFTHNVEGVHSRSEVGTGVYPSVHQSHITLSDRPIVGCCRGGRKIRCVDLCLHLLLRSQITNGLGI